jgi:hypothetical protein
MNAVWKKGAAAVLGAVMLLGALPGGAAAHAAPLGAVSNVLMIYQSPTVVTEHDAFTVFMELDNTSNIHQVYFTFCQITTPLCYLPIVMTPDGPHWFEGTTKPMTSYHGMAPGVRAGYNITVLFNDSTNITEPSLPNPFTNLTVTDTITGELVFEITVGNPIYGLSGHVYDSATGAPLSRANVALTPGSNTTTTNASGAYAFSGLANGSDTLTVTYLKDFREVKGMVANGNVRMSQGTRYATGDHGVLDRRVKGFIKVLHHRKIFLLSRRDRI